MNKNPVMADFREAFQACIADWKSIFDEGRHGTEFAEITAEEVAVFAIDLEQYPAMVALYEAYEALKNICDMGSFDSDLCAGVRENLGLQDDGHTSVEELQALGQVVGVGHREAYAMYHKVKFWEIRSGLIRFKDEASNNSRP